MLQIFRVGPYSIYFWSNENNPLEPIHVHIAEGKATANATKVRDTLKVLGTLRNHTTRRLKAYENEGMGGFRWIM